MLNGLLIFAQLTIRGPVKGRSAVFVGIQPLKLFLREKRFVRIKRLNLQEPSISVFVPLDKFQPQIEGYVLGLEFGAGHMLAVDHVLLWHRKTLNFRPAVGAEARISQLFDIANPLIAFLTAHQIKRGVALVIGSAPILPVVMMIRHLMGVNSLLVQQFGHGIVKRLQRPPGTMQKIVPTRVHFATRRHARHGTDIKIIELHCALG